MTRKRNISLSTLRRLVLYCMLLLVVPFAPAQEPGWEAKWNHIVAAGKKEGKVVFAAAPDPLMRRLIPEKFTARFGIRVEYLAGRSSDMGTRLQMERQGGIFSVDAVTAGVQSMSAHFYREKLIDPLKPALILPEVV